MRAAIEASKPLLDLGEDWDGAGSPPPSPEAWERAYRILVSRESLPVPRIMPGPDASFDLHWKTATRELLLSVPADWKAPVTYYGDDDGALGDRIEGSLGDRGMLNDLFEWLAK
jgi:hypothetical protein